jgi:cbb3-type cytochrome oxidase subunit 3
MRSNRTDNHYSMKTYLICIFNGSLFMYFLVIIVFIIWKANKNKFDSSDETFFSNSHIFLWKFINSVNNLIFQNRFIVCPILLYQNIPAIISPKFLNCPFLQHRQTKLSLNLTNFISPKVYFCFFCSFEVEYTVYRLKN